MTFTTQLYVTKPKTVRCSLLFEFQNQIRNASQQTNSGRGPGDGLTIQPTSIRLTLTAIVIIPIMLVYPFIQKYYVKGDAMDCAVKGCTILESIKVREENSLAHRMSVIPQNK